jgi:hypothetical protein
MFDRLRSMFQPKPVIADPYEQFVAAFIEECKRQDRNPASYDHPTRSFVFRSDPKEGEQRIFLENTFREWLPRDAKARAGLMTRFVRSIGEMERHASIDPSKLPAELMPGIRSRALISDVLIRNWTLGAPEGNTAEYAWAPFCGELAACVVRDLERNWLRVMRLLA